MARYGEPKARYGEPKACYSRAKVPAMASRRPAIRAKLQQTRVCERSAYEKRKNTPYKAWP